MRKLHRLDFAVGLIIAILGLSCSGSGDSKSRYLTDGDPGHPPSLNKERSETYADDDSIQTFVDEAGSDGLMEVQLANIALEKSQNTQVKELAEMIRKDHQEANQKLKALTKQSEKLKAPEGMLDKHKEMLSRLSQLSGAEFDQEYVQAMIEGHKKAVDRFRRIAENLKTSQAEKPGEQQSGQELQKWIENNIPVMEKHLDQAREISGQSESGLSQ